MSDVYRLLLDLHVLTGTLALTTFWGALLAGKGGRLHRRCGRGFAASMAITIVTAVILCGLLLADPIAARPPAGGLSAAEREEYARIVRGIAAALLEVSIVAGALLHFGLRALGRGRGDGTGARVTDLAVAGIVISLGLLMLDLGLDPELPWFEGHGIVVAVVGGLRMRALLRVRRTTSARVVEHLFRHQGREYLLDDSLNTLETRLQGDGFLRVHRGELINLSHVRALHVEDGATSVELSDGQHASVSRRTLALLKQRLGMS
jgi:hypothetical protein